MPVHYFGPKQIFPNPEGATAVSVYFAETLCFKLNEKKEKTQLKKVSKRAEAWVLHSAVPPLFVC